MSEALPVVYLARHGETAWTVSGQHTGLTDLPLTERGERNARRLEERLRGLICVKVFTSPLQRAIRTCELAGFGSLAEIDRDLLEWNYGEYEGRLTSDIHRERPDWQLFRDGCPGGESPQYPCARLQRAGQYQHAAGTRHPQSDRPLQPGHRCHRPDAPFPCHRRERSRGAGQPADPVSRTRLPVRHRSTRHHGLEVAILDLALLGMTRRYATGKARSGGFEDLWRKWNLRQRKTQ